MRINVLLPIGLIFLLLKNIKVIKVSLQQWLKNPPMLYILNTLNS